MSRTNHCWPRFWGPPCVCATPGIAPRTGRYVVYTVHHTAHLIEIGEHGQPATTTTDILHVTSKQIE